MEEVERNGKTLRAFVEMCQKDCRALQGDVEVLEVRRG